MHSSVRKNILAIAISSMLMALGLVAYALDTQRERVVVHDGRAEIWHDGRVVWTSPQDWSVEALQRGDVNGDGIEDIVALVDAPGEYGKLRPFWIAANDPNVRQHLYIFDLIDGNVRPVWMTSRIFAPTCFFTLRNVLHNGRKQLITLDGDGSAKNGACQTPKQSVWDWDGWGFSKVSGVAP